MIEKELESKCGKVKISFYEGVLKLSELKNINMNELVLPLGIIIDKDYVNNKAFTDNEELFFDMFCTYYCSPKKDKIFKTTYTQISIEKLFKLFFEDKIFLDKLILSDNNEKQISYITFSDTDFVLGFINKRKLFNRKKDVENISLKEMIYSSICQYLKSISLEYFSEEKKPDLTFFELYDKEEDISVFFDTEEERNLFINPSGSNGKIYKLDFYYHKDGIDNVVVETNENGEISFYKIIDEEICVPYEVVGNNIIYKSKTLYWPIIDALKRRGISFLKDKCKVK